MSFIHDTMLVFRRQERLALRQPAWVIIGLMQPILYLALFGPLLKGLPGSSLGGGGNAYRFFVPGLLIQLGLFGSTTRVPSAARSNTALPSRVQVVPASVDLRMPPPGPETAAKTVCGLAARTTRPL